MRAQAAQAIERSVRRQAQLVDDLLDISRIVAGKLLMDVRRMDLLPVIRSAIATLEPAADAKRLVIDLVPGGNRSEVRGDPDRLEQVMWNLLSNAVKFTPAGGKIAARLRRSGSQLEVSVTDTGCGIPAAELPHVFERFHQGGQKANGGLGLGLAIAKHLVELHGGSISAASPGPGLGTTIALLLPGAEAQ
jgi:signal transduction histidine kinase